MSTAATTEKKPGWFGGLIDGAARALAFGGTQRQFVAEPERSRAQPKRAPGASDLKGKASLARKLAADGTSVTEIARQTSLSQDTVTLLLHLPAVESDESAARGTFFRILQTRMND